MGVGLADVVVCSELQTVHHVVQRVLGRAEDDRDSGRVLAFLHDGGHLGAAQIAHHDVEENQVEGRQVEGQGLFRRVGGDDFVSLVFKIETECLAQGLLGVYDQNSLFVIHI
jgi:hypothetical protein